MFSISLLSFMYPYIQRGKTSKRYTSTSIPPFLPIIHSIPSILLITFFLYHLFQPLHSWCTGVKLTQLSSSYINSTFLYHSWTHQNKSIPPTRRTRSTMTILPNCRFLRRNRPPIAFLRTQNLVKPPQRQTPSNFQHQRQK